MKRIVSFTFMVAALALLLVPGLANATFTMTPAQLQALYQTYEKSFICGDISESCASNNGGAQSIRETLLLMEAGGVRL